MSAITVIIHTYNSAAKLPKLLSSLTWCERIIAIDMESSDDTRRILETAGAEIHTLDRQPWRDSLRNPYLELPKTAWTLVMDSDEYLADDSAELCAELIASATKDAAAFALPRYNSCFGRILEGSRWYPDRQIRLFRTNSVRYPNLHHMPPTPVDPSAKVVWPDLDKSPHIYHDHYGSIREFIERQNRYAITDKYEGDVDWSKYMNQAIEGIHAAKSAPSEEERAMEIVLAWDRVIRALLHWEEQGRSEAIPSNFGWAFGPMQSQKRRLSSLFKRAKQFARKLAARAWLRAILRKVMR